MRTTILALLLATAITPALAKPAHHQGHGAQATKVDYAAAVAAPGRPAAATALDASRKPAEVLAFMQLKPGMTALDFLTGSGYYAEIIGNVVGPKGSVTAYAPATLRGEQTQAAFADLTKRTPNVTLTNAVATAFAPNSYDFAIIHLDYHDLYWESAQYGIPRTDPNMVLAALFKAMKKGGTVAIIDHVGPAGDTRAIVDKLHRIDPETVKADFVRAGFVLDGSSDVLHMADDDHSKNVFDPSIRGKTDRFVFRFKKP